MCFRGPILSVPTGFHITNGKAMNTMIQSTVPARRMVVELRLRCWMVAFLLAVFSGGCARVTPNHEPAPSDLQVTADSLKVAVREAQRTAAELRTELDEQRKELADAQVARAQLQGMLRETERRLTEARQIIELQREELASARTERDRVAQAVQPLHSRLRQSSPAAPAHSKNITLDADTIAPASADTQEQVAEDSGAQPEGVTPAPVSREREGQQDSNPAGTATVSLPTIPEQRAPVRTIVVQGGDTLWRLARRHKVELQALRSLNGLSGNLIVTGRTLRLPEPRLQHAALQPAAIGTLVQ